jgi:hypothetical protein
VWCLAVYADARSPREAPRARRRGTAGPVVSTREMRTPRPKAGACRSPAGKLERRALATCADNRKPCETRAEKQQGPGLRRGLAGQSVTDDRRSTEETFSGLWAQPAPMGGSRGSSVRRCFGCANRKPATVRLEYLLAPVASSNRLTEISSCQTAKSGGSKPGQPTKPGQGVPPKAPWPPSPQPTSPGKPGNPPKR